MKRTDEVIFPPFRLDLVNEQLWRGDLLVPLRPTAFAVLRYLVEHAGRLVTKEEMLNVVWPGTRVSEGIQKRYIRELRQVLGDDAEQPQFIETVPRRGHRFIATVRTAAPVSRSMFHVSRSTSPSAAEISTVAQTAFQRETVNVKPETLLVGREAELAHLHRLFEKAMSGQRQMVFVTGEPGIGKTTLVEEFLFGVRSRGKFGVEREEESQNAKVKTQKSKVSETQSSALSPQSLSSPDLRPLTPDPWIGRGQCIEQHGAGEAYLPVLEALGRIGREPGGEPFVATVQQYAPTWLVQMPALVGAAELETLQRRVLGATRERMLREMVEAIEVLTAERPLVLWLEDLHWADASTVDWLAAIAQQSAPARLFVIGTYRPSDLSLSNHPLRAVKQELVAKGQCDELLLPFFSADDVTQYLTRRYAHHDFPSSFGTAIHRSTDGNPLFVVHMVDYLNAQGVIAEVDGYWHLQSRVEDITRGVPDSVRQLIEKQVERLSEEQQQLLEVASVAGVTFSAPAVAVGLEEPVEKVEKWCDGLIKRGQFLQTQEPQVLPDGTLCGSYGFQHALQHAVVYERIPHLQRLRLHRRIGESQAQHYGEHASFIAAELAMHFERGGDLPRAVQYRQQAGHNALRQHGYQEAISHFRQGLNLLATFPDTPERQQQELALQVTLGSPLQALHGYGAPEVEAAYTRARELSQQVGDTAQLFPVLRGLYVFYLLRGKLQIALEFGKRLLSLAQSTQDPAFLLEGHFAFGQALMFRGELIAAREHLEHGIALYDPVQHRSHAFLYGQDPGVFCHVLAAWDLGLLGYPNQALQRSQEALVIAQEVAHPLSVAAARTFFTLTHQSRGEVRAAQERAEAAIALSAQQEFPFFLAFGTLLRGWALAEQGHVEEGIAQLRQGIAAYRATGAELAMTRWLVFLAEAGGKVGQPEEGLSVLAEVLTIMDNNGEREYEAELYRLKGTLTLQSQASFGQVSDKSKKSQNKSKVTDPRPLTPDPQAEAEECFFKAITIAQKQQAKSLELRAVMSLVRLRQQQALYTTRNTQHVPRNTSDEPRATSREPRTLLTEAHNMLSEVYNWFTEGFDTKDLQEAKALLDSLESRV